MDQVNENGWKLFRSRLPVWQTHCVEELIAEYKTLLNSDAPVPDKYRALEERVRKDKCNPGVLLCNLSRSHIMMMHLTRFFRIR